MQGEAMIGIADLRRSRASGTRSGELVAGSLAWQIEQLGSGEVLFKPGPNETARRTGLRAIAKVIKRHPGREYDLDLWLALHHSGTGESIRLYRINRIR
ncbi:MULTISPECIES: hypothetical protein [Paraburkholderia]|jgi:hypothetical protein|uniref:hypothetical protein n=1 Tax=Paraburkholderia TaxID=1822464 RepID=UPI0038BA528F